MKTKFTTILWSLTLLVVLATSCGDGPKKETPVDDSYGLNFALMDTTTRPQDDFYRFVNGKWLDQNEIPDDETNWGSFGELRRNTDKDMLDIIQKALADPALDKKSDQAKALFLYQSILDTVTRNQQGIQPIVPLLEKINTISSVSDLQQFIIEQQQQGDSNFFSFWVRSDFSDSNNNATYLGASGLGLPDKDYYLKDDADLKDKREKYVEHITRMLQFLGDSEEWAAEQAARILAFETQLATARLDRVERRDARKLNNPLSVSDIQLLVPQIDWRNYLNQIGAEEVDTLIVTELEYIKSLNGILAKNQIDDWKLFLRWSALNSAAGQLSTEIEKANWDFYAKTMSGAKQQKPIEERALATVNRVMGEALGKLYVAEKFPPEAKEAAKKMIDKVVEAFDTRIKALEWMTEATQEKALIKLHKINIKIGYPDVWKDYSAMEINSVEDGGSYYSNLQAARQWSFNRAVSKIGEPVDKTEWSMSPQTVNAYYSPSYNEIVFPAAILQPPFYHYKADPALNFGGIGAVIGHEISHGFDDSGSRYDADGNLSNWWTDDDLAAFTALGERYADQYSAIEVLPGHFINGKLSLGENIGDLGGTNAALDGLRLYLAEHGDPGLIDGFTQEQRFFISWATIWRIKYREEAMIRQLRLGPHAPGDYRGWVPIRNLDAFHEAFNTQEGDPMYIAPEDRIKIW